MDYKYFSEVSWFEPAVTIFQVKISTEFLNFQLTFEQSLFLLQGRILRDCKGVYFTVELLTNFNLIFAL